MAVKSSGAIGETPSHVPAIKNFNLVVRPQQLDFKT